jgi:hypothetical protein
VSAGEQRVQRDDVTGLRVGQYVRRVGWIVAAYTVAIPPARETPRHRLIPTHGSGQIAFGHYSWREAPHAFLPHAITVLALRGPEITEGTFREVNDAAAFAGFGLPAQVAADR